MKAKYDIARLHKDCLAWCENPTWKPWMVESGFAIKKTQSGYGISRNADIVFAFWISNDSKLDCEYTMPFAHFIGLDVESYRILEIDRDQAVRDYLAGIEECGELVDGWVKYTDSEAVFAASRNGRINLIVGDGIVCLHAYTFLRLDLKEDKQ